VDLENTRFQPAAMAGLRAADVPRLKLRWAFGFPGATLAVAQPTVAGGRVFVGSVAGTVYALDAVTGCTHWSYSLGKTPARTAISMGPRAGGGWTAYVGDHTATVYALDAAQGALLWKTKVDDFWAARLTGAPALYAGRLYVPVSSHEEVQGSNAKYECCKFRGSVVALDAATGRQIWKTYTIAQEARPTRKNRSGTQMWGPAGAAIWSAPTLDAKARLLYVATGNAYTDPDPGAGDAILALDLDTGKLRWSRQFTANDWYTMGCRKADNCLDPVGPDFDFGASPILRTLRGGRRVLIAGQKSGMVWALDPDRSGEVLWSVRVGQGSALGGVQFGPAADEEVVYVAVSDVLGPTEKAGGLWALRLADGSKVWHTPAPSITCRPGARGCIGAQSAAVTAIPGVAFSGSIDGHLRAYDAAGGRIVWDFDTNRMFPTVNGVAGQGGSIDGPGPTVAGGMLYTNSGYGLFRGAPGNVLLAFEVQ
jgi:polyvinyl alcohol dehydrogenase (cytochrome)